MWLVLTLALVLPTTSAESQSSALSSSLAALKASDHSCNCGKNCGGRCCCLRRSSTRQAGPTPPSSASVQISPPQSLVCLTAPPCGSHNAPAGAAFSVADSLCLGRFTVIANPRDRSQPFVQLADVAEHLGRSRPPAKPPKILQAG